MAPRVTREPRPLPTRGGRRRKGPPRCSSGGSPSRAAAVAPSSWQPPHREVSSQLPVGHASSAVVAKVAADHSSASSSSGYFSPRDEVSMSISSLQSPCMSSPSGCSPRQPGLSTCVAADAVVGASSGNPSAALPSSLPEEEEPLSPALRKEIALQILYGFDWARERRMLTADELDFYDHLVSLLPRLEAEIEEDNADGADAVVIEAEIGEVNADRVDAVVIEADIGEVNADGTDAVVTASLGSSSFAFLVIEAEIAEVNAIGRDAVVVASSCSSSFALLVIEAEIGEVNAIGTDAVVVASSGSSSFALLVIEVEIGEVNAIGTDAVVIASSGSSSAALLSSLPEEEEEEEEKEEEEEELLSPILRKEVALEILFRLDLTRKKRMLSDGELDLYCGLKSLLPRLEAEIREVNADGADAVAIEEEEEEEEGEEEEEEEHFSPAFQKAVALEVLFRLDLVRKRRMLSDSELDLYNEQKSLLPRLEAEIREVNADRVDAVAIASLGSPSAAHPSSLLQELLSPALKMEVALKVLFRLDLAREMRTLSASELDLYDHLWSLLPRFEAEIGELNATAPRTGSGNPSATHPSSLPREEEEEEEKEEELFSSAFKKEVAFEVLFRLDLARKKRMLCDRELDLYCALKSLLPRLEVEIREFNADGADAVAIASSGNASAAHPSSLPEEEELFSPAFQKAVALEVLFRLDLVRKKRMLSDSELDLYHEQKSVLPRLEAEIREVNADRVDAVAIASSGSPSAAHPSSLLQELLSPALKMEVALKVLFRLDLAREMRTLSAGELDLYDHLRYLLSCLEGEIGELNATTPIIGSEDLICQLHAPSVALGGTNEVPSPPVLGASSSIKNSAYLPLAEHNVGMTSAELSIPGPEATPSAHESSVEPEPDVEVDEITEALYGHSVHCRLPVFCDIC